MVPCLAKYSRSVASLFQIASKTKIWILDILPKNGKNSKEMIEVFIEEVMQADNILKLGLGIKGDLAKFKKCFRILKDFVKFSKTN